MNSGQNHDYMSYKPSVELNTVDGIDQTNSQLTSKNGKSETKDQINGSFFFKNQNYRNDIVNESKYQIRDYDMNNMNSLNIID